MFEKFTDFDGKRFPNLWGGFSCECFIDGIDTFVMFYTKDKKEVLSLSGNEANDILDFVLSEYYKNENSTIEDGFSTWLMKHYDNVIPMFDGVEPKFKVGDWIAYEELNTAKIISIKGDRYEVEFIDGNKGVPHIDYIDRIFHLWSINDAKDGDVLASDGGICIFNGNLEDGKHPLAYCGITKRGFDFYNLDVPFSNGNNIHPATKEQRKLLFQKMKEDGYQWDNEKKELKEIVSKLKSKENKPRYDIGDALCTTDDIPLSVSFKILLKDWKRQNRIIKKQKKEIKKLKDKINELSSNV